MATTMMQMMNHMMAMAGTMPTESWDTLLTPPMMMNRVRSVNRTAKNSWLPSKSKLPLAASAMLHTSIETNPMMYIMNMMHETISAPRFIPSPWRML